MNETTPTPEEVKRLKGIDVSHHNGTIDWKQVKASGVEFAFLKASEGIDFVDETFATNRKGAREVGITVGYYHYMRPNDTVADQVKLFVSTVGKLELDAMRPVLDCEDPRIWKPYSIKERVKMIVEWCRAVKKALGANPMLYGSPSFFEEILGNAPELAEFDLWIANYNVEQPIVPKPWTEWTFWQHSEKGKVPGIDTGTDLNWYNGSDLKKARAKEHEAEDSGPTSMGMKIVYAIGITLWLAGLIAVLYEHFCRH